MQIDFHPQATAELTDAAEWYFERSPTASRNFLVAVDVPINSFVSDPHRFVHIDGRHQSCSVIKFPFQIVFRQNKERIVILAIAHAKRRTDYWRNR